jgi:hypothetical protein
LVKDSLPHKRLTTFIEVEEKTRFPELVPGLQLLRKSVKLTTARRAANPNLHKRAKDVRGFLA